MNPWEDENGATDVDGFLAAFAKNDNIFWYMESGHALNIIEELIERLEYAKALPFEVINSMLEGDEGDEMSSDAVEWAQEILKRLQ
jgi:hypothetical protein